MVLENKQSLSNNKLILKNTIFLYIRMLLLMAVSIYTSRVVLQVLGVSDYGIYNLVGGMVVFFQFVNSTINGILQRFYNVDLGNSDSCALSATFHTGITLQLIFSFGIIVIGESLGLYILYDYLNIAPDRLNAAFWVLQFSILNFCISLLRTPFTAMLIALEKMGLFAYLSIAEAVFKLLSIYVLLFLIGDKLIMYSSLQCIIVFITLIIYAIYVCRLTGFSIAIRTSKLHLKKLATFSGWNLLGSIFALSVNQAISFYINVFFGVIYNAASGVAAHLSGSINQFVSHFSMAFNPQIVKLHTANEREKLFSLIYRSSKISYLLYIIVAFPFLCLSDTIIDLWLDEVPPMAVIFSNLCIIDYAIESFASPLWASIQASGKIKYFNLGLMGIFALNIPILYIVLLLGGLPWCVYLVKIIIDFINLIFRIIYATKCIKMPLSLYLKNIMKPTMTVTILTLPFLYLCLTLDNIWTRIFLGIFILVPLIAFSGIFFCFDKGERKSLMKLVKSKLNK